MQAPAQGGPVQKETGRLQFVKGEAEATQGKACV